MTTQTNKVIAMFGFLAEHLNVFRELFNADIEINFFELPQENHKDTVKQIDNFYIHQYASANHSNKSRLDEILRDMLAIHADYYFVVKTAPLYDEVYKHLTHYGYKVIVI